MKIFIKHHLGMGDNVVHNGMIRKISESYSDAEIFVASKHHNFNNVKYMFRDNPKINVLSVEGDGEMHDLVNKQNFDKIISSHFCNGTPYPYEKYFDDAFYMLVGMDPIIKTEYFYIDRDLVLENKIYKELISDRGIVDYVFVHEKPEQNIIINRNLLEKNLPVITAEPKYGMFELLTVIEKAKSVNIISSSFLSLMMCKKYNPKTIAHMYCDRPYISQYIKKHDIDVIL